MWSFGSFDLYDGVFRVPAVIVEADSTCANQLSFLVAVAKLCSFLVLREICI